jgi:hypothetical protein
VRHVHRKLELDEFVFHQSYSKLGYVLAGMLPVAIEIANVHNEAKPLYGEESEFSDTSIF